MRLNFVNTTKKNHIPIQSHEIDSSRLLDCNTSLGLFKLSTQDIEHREFKKVVNEANVHFFFPLQKSFKVLVDDEFRDEIVCPPNVTTIIVKNGKEISYDLYEDSELIYFGMAKNKLKNLAIKNHPYNSKNNQNLGFKNSLYTQLTSDSSRIEQIAQKLELKNDKLERVKDLAKTYKEELKYIFLNHFFNLNQITVLKSKELDLIKKLPEIIKSQRKRPLTIGCLCRNLDLSIEKLKLGTEKVFKSSPDHLIDTIKLEQIVKEYKIRKKNLAEVIYQNGVLSRKEFYRTFEEHFGAKPYTYFKIQ
ncbi:helix-turn-helix transcriptional regulator [Winogradskyella ursingii]|uniref:hypothetical protein n=1 Tax=Winogradskyella ursingii TaxID=2686079 RepID=UPI0015C7DEA1|nr:hypothetical protein [Winogradskyella ursingii]